VYVPSNIKNVHATLQYLLFLFVISRSLKLTALLWQFHLPQLQLLTHSDSTESVTHDPPRKLVLTICTMHISARANPTNFCFRCTINGTRAAASCSGSIGAIFAVCAMQPCETRVMPTQSIIQIKNTIEVTFNSHQIRAHTFEES